MRRWQASHWVARAAVVAAALAGMVGCSSTPHPGSPLPSTMSTVPLPPQSATTPAAGNTTPAACSGLPPTTAAAPTVMSTAAAGAAALTAYRCMWQEMQVAALTANYQDPVLARYASGAALQTLVSGLHNAHQQGVVVRGSLLIKPEVVAVTPASTPDQAVIHDCTDDTNWLNYNAKTGQLQDNVPGGRRYVEAVVTEMSGQWTVSQLAVHGEGSCAD